MKALVLESVGRLVVREVPVPTAKPGWSVIEVLGCGICGTDRHILHGAYPASPPLIPGHEFGGLISEPSPECPLPAGALVCVDPNIVCGECPDCLAGRTAFCPSRIALGVDIDGGLAQYALVPDTQLYALPASVPPLHLPLVEPLACCLRGLDLAGLRGGESVCVVGGGVMGQLMVQLARTAGASTICMSTRSPQRRELARMLGATHTEDPSGPFEAAGDFDVVFECAGTTDAVESALARARRGGSVIILGITAQDARVAVQPYDLVFRELRVQGSFLNPLTHGRAAALVADGALDLDPLVTRVVDLADAGQVIAGHPGPADVKVVISPAGRTPPRG